MSVVPTLAVIIPNFNYSRFIRKAIDSVVGQKHPLVEVVVIDDGSTDDSWEIISEYTEVKAARVVNGGQLKACVVGLDMTNANFIMFLDADDELKSGSLDRIVQSLDAGVSKLQFALTRVDSSGKPLGGTSPKYESYRDNKKLRQQILKKGVYRSPPTSGNVFRRDVCEYLKEVDYDGAVDGVILYIAPFLGDVISISDELGSYRVHGGNISNIGSEDSTVHLKEDLRRFRGQMQHLSLILNRLGLRGSDYEQEFIIQERLFQIAVAEGRRPSLKSILRLVKSLRNEEMTTKNKGAIAAFSVASLLLPRNSSRNILAYRMQPGERSFRGLVRVILK